MGTYFIEDDEGYVKIGHSRDYASAKRRLGDLQVGNPRKLRLRAWCPNMQEKDLHYEFGKVWIRGEWFLMTKKMKNFLMEHSDAWGEMLADELRIGNIF